MYTVVLMTALTAAPSSQGWLRGCHGCCAARCHAAASSAYSSGGYGAGYYGCYGCYAGALGRASYSSGSYGWAGGVSPYQCHSYGGCQACSGCYSGCACNGYARHTAPTEAAPPSGTPPVMPGAKPEKIEKPLPPPPLPKKTTEEQARARVIVDMPADATLYVDGQLMALPSGARRIFQTPQLIAGQSYYYELKAEVIRDGRTVSAQQRLVLRPGDVATANFAELGRTGDATARAGHSR